jgi:hypothetical protein
MVYPQKTDFVFRAKRTSPFKSGGGASVHSTTGSRGVRISGSNAGYTMFRGSVKSTGYPLHSLVSPSLPLPCVTVCHHVSTDLYIYLSLPTLCTDCLEIWESQPPGTFRACPDPEGLFVCRSHWPRGLRRRSAPARLLRSWVRIPPVGGHGCLSVVSVVCCQV